VKPRTVSARAELTVWEAGPPDGRPVLLVHGFPDHAIGMLPFAGRLAARGMHVVAPSLPGYPPSQPIPDGDYSLSAVAGDLEAIMERLDLRDVAVIGHDWGAALAYQLGGAGAERVTCLVAISAPHPRAFGLRRRVLAEQQSAAYAIFLAYSSRGPEVCGDPRWLTELSHAWSPALYRADWPEVLDHLTAPGASEAVCAYYRADLEEAGEPCGPIRTPTTVVYGGQDGCLRPTLYVDAERHFEGPVRQHHLPAVGHWPHLESPEEVESIVLEALAR
jgi:pimeloyl-ACP methyl ester carboxylesterase